MDNTPYDDVFRTLLTDCTELMIPVVNEIFHTHYTGKETICLLQNEHFIKMPDGSEQERITDSSFEIISEETAPIAQGQKKRYHIECQSTEDGSMIVRMFEYDTQLALENREVTAGALVVHFPDSANRSPAPYEKYAGGDDGNDTHTGWGSIVCRSGIKSQTVYSRRNL